MWLGRARCGLGSRIFMVGRGAVKSGAARQGSVWFGYKGFRGLARSGEARLGAVWFGCKSFRGKVKFGRVWCGIGVVWRGLELRVYEARRG